MGHIIDLEIESPYAREQMWAGQRHLQRLLRQLPSGSEAYIAGGAPRDWHHGWGCRDIDIFFKTPEEDSLNLKYRGLKDISQYSYYNGKELIDVHEYPVSSGFLKFRNVQLIRLAIDPLKFINHFPINMSRVWMDMKGKVRCSEEYKIGYYGKYFLELHREQWNYAYISKILGRYSNYAFIPYKWKDDS